MLHFCGELWSKFRFRSGGTQPLPKKLLKWLGAPLSALKSIFAFLGQWKKICIFILYTLFLITTSLDPDYFRRYTENKMVNSETSSSCQMMLLGLLFLGQGFPRVLVRSSRMRLVSVGPRFWFAMALRNDRVSIWLLDGGWTLRSPSIFSGHLGSSASVLVTLRLAPGDNGFSSWLSKFVSAFRR